MVIRRFASLAALALSSAGAASAQPVSAPAGETLRLSPEEKAEIAAHQTEATVDAARAGLSSADAGRRIHGEIGAAVGSDGMRAVYGTAAIPLGDHAGATVSFENGRYRSPR